MLIIAAVALTLTMGVALAQRDTAPGQNKVLVCHMVGTEDQAEVEVPAHSAVATKHVDEGNSILGPCPLPYP